MSLRSATRSGKSQARLRSAPTSADPSIHFVDPWRTRPPYEDPPPHHGPTPDPPLAEETPPDDELKRSLVLLFLRRYITWCARTRRFAAMEGAARLFAELQCLQARHEPCPELR